MDKRPTYCELEEQLAEALQRAKGAEELKNSFLANISHEIRTPMNAIIGASDILRDESLTNEERNEFASILNISSRSLLDLLNRIIDLSQLDSGIMELHESEIDLEALVIRLFTTYKDKIELLEKDITIEYQINCPNPNIIIDGEKLEKSISYLLDNAINFTQKGKILISCSLQDDKKIQILVKDTGSGISPEQKESIFNRFNQVDNSYTRKQSGAGIGLSLCSRYINLMNGELKLDSVLGKGSSFHLNVPTRFKSEDLETIETNTGIQSSNPLID
ncbi:ATP-binding protein [Ancylomarina sp. DW003]|nr:ATP-binding protein [Ancylomarina sp. DW003]MDE5423204.1 ATP-binding protein [Ancylomarina sp. DW003]